MMPEEPLTQMITRRELMTRTAIGLAAGVPFASEVNAAPLGLPIGCQTYPVRNSIAKDFEGTLKELAAAGFKTIELCSPHGYEKQGYGGLPVCMAKTHLSISHDPKLIGAPEGYAFPIREVRLAAGAGFIYPLAGEMRTMPGLPAHPAAERVDIDEHGNTVGLS